MKKVNAGFTLIELVIVIVILGILAATALPRFIDVTDQAHEAAVQGAAGGLGSGVQLARAMWFARGQGTDDIEMDGATIAHNDGWPTGVQDAVPTDAGCVLVWENVMQNPPSVADSGTTTDYVASADGTVCTYTYQPGNAHTIEYDSDDGSVTVTIVQ